MSEYGIVLYWSRTDEAFLAEAPDLPGCMAHGETREAALRNVQNAMALWLESSEEFGEPVPPPKTGRLAMSKSVDPIVYHPARYDEPSTHSFSEGLGRSRSPRSSR